ncbi:hypothetical protein F5Y06DRAFT_166815 [Hypoxylon sp. FL0890]|nr:hypothetical protein F5Y06DRAFT_166815 [Hypoxylon sp. FL0890]
MAIKHLALLALAGSAFAQMTSLETGAMSLTDISPMTDSTSGSQPTDSSADMSSSSMMTMDSDSATSMPTEMSSWMSASSNANTGEATSMPMESSMSGSTMMDMSSMTTDTATMAGMPMSTGGMMPNATGAGETPTPVQGAGIINGVSVGLIALSMALAVLIQL